ncbi:ATP-binding protein [Emticicia sp. 21SJ11W-3]|uniref:ATP-binding protein n=1 Tax=Emticicia sp. 21SJ11W-3 TaxID=2916755 RepID=UPI00209F8656|nr:ATP-binding protein [Emticicia sp. 21SJ11W-3]UTA66338.1 cell wall metabolism sensor histidine kinase WalK [Emticicia sp. 21SJ11W-3]
MKIRTKLTLGVGLLFILITLLTFVGARYINALKNDTENILEANYITLEYARDMLMALDEVTSDSTAMNILEENLKKQQANITEIGEREATRQLLGHFKMLQANRAEESVHLLIRKDIAEIMRLNMEAIQRKSNVAKQTAASATIWVATTGTLCFLIAFTLLINLPGNIANPIRKLTESIKLIAANDYSQRVYFEDHNEFGELALSFNTMAEKLEEYNNSNLSKLLFEKKRIETLINNMHDPVIGLDENKKILFANDEALKVTGLKPEQLIGQQAQDVSLMNDLLRSLVKDLVLTPSTDTQSKKQPIKIFADNKESYFEKEIIDIAIVPTGEKEKRQIGHVIVLKNITPFKELDFAKTNFIATISHELKTPISSIKMSLQLLENQQTGAINEEQKQLIDSIKEDSHRLLKITGELLNLSQVETGNIQLNIQKSTPYEILHYATEAVKTQAAQKKIDIQTEVPENLPAVKADTEKTAWVLINFLTNAINYSPEQSRITIRINQTDTHVNFSVSDQGKGIEKRYKDKIFDKYFQVPGSNKSGTGLGLAISKEFIEAQNGSIGVESEIGMGSTFYFNLAVVEG